MRCAYVCEAGLVCTAAGAQPVHVFAHTCKVFCAAAEAGWFLCCRRVVWTMVACDVHAQYTASTPHICDVHSQYTASTPHTCAAQFTRRAPNIVSSLRKAHPGDICTVHLRCIWCAQNAHLQCMWCAQNTHLQCKRFAQGTHLQCIWFSRRAHTLYAAMAS